jgi:hypothetical protein
MSGDPANRGDRDRSFSSFAPQFFLHPVVKIKSKLHQHLHETMFYAVLHLLPTTIPNLTLIKLRHQQFSPTTARRKIDRTLAVYMISKIRFVNIYKSCSRSSLHTLTTANQSGGGYQQWCGTSLYQLISLPSKICSGGYLGI